MSYCRICGTERSIAYRDRSRMTLCDSCHADTPAKVGFGEFCRGYFDADPDSLSGLDRRIAREFYDDYRCSRYGAVADYRAATTELA